MKNKKLFDSFGKITALVTFTIATMIFAFYLFTGNLDYGFFGYLFFLLAVPSNIIILIILLFQTSKSEFPKKNSQGIRFMFLNIPVAIFYFGIGIYFTGIMRITFKNNTGEDIKKIKIVGCENEELDILKNGETETIWIDINGDCSINISYTDAKGKIQNETVLGYVTSGMGQKYIYKIGQGETGF